MYYNCKLEINNYINIMEKELKPLLNNKCSENKVIFSYINKTDDYTQIVSIVLESYINGRKILHFPSYLPSNYISMIMDLPTNIPVSICVNNENKIQHIHGTSIGTLYIDKFWNNDSNDLKKKKIDEKLPTFTLSIKFSDGVYHIKGSEDNHNLLLSFVKRIEKGKPSKIGTDLITRLESYSLISKK